MNKTEFSVRVEEKKNELRGKVFIQEMLTQLARHYKMDRGSLMELLLARQVLGLQVLTNFKNDKANEAELIETLKTLHLEEMKIADRFAQAITKANDVIEMAANNQAEGTRVLAKIRKEIGI